ncbi:4-coumarate--CoA ligase 1-like [Trichoplusia ni]|uniref:4-coumarate--CoA ligase 1-like n=1 Tax=Trichoplusia ni TaxID=7111 RepID=A0A7E5VT18_TRINI|nr:4-coumarate--CoA ligase 1-like [Trichoplusia ni]
MMNDDGYVYGDQNVQVPAHLNFGKFILDRLRLRRDEIALELGETGEKLTYKEFTQYAVNMSTALTKLGVGRGDIVAVGSEKRNEFVPTVLAIVFTGATYTPYDLKSGRAVLKHKISITKPKYFICSSFFWKTYSDILLSFDCIEKFITLDDGVESVISIRTLVTNDVDINKFEPMQVQGQVDIAFILYSSGTTGMPKGVQLTHLNCILNSLPDDFSDDSLQTAFVFGEWYHNYDTFMTYKFLALGRKMVYVNEAEPQTFLKSVQDCRVNIAFIVPSFVCYLSKAKEAENFDLDSLKIIYSRSSPLHNKTIQKVKTRFPKLKNILQGYGMTEAGELTSESWGTKGCKAGSVGMASPGITLKVADPETRKTLGPNQRGEICLRGPVFMKGYIGVPPSKYLDEQGFFKTGDLGYYDDDKYFFIVERLKEVLVYDGYKVAPLELETILQLHPGVREAGVVGKPAGVYGEEPTAFVVKQPGVEVTEKELIDYVATEVPPYMQLRGGVKFIQELPRNPRGKLMRQRLREMLN